MDGKIVFLAIAIVAVGMFALPSTLAMYTGQHSFVNASEVSCDKCHPSTSGIGLELAGSNITAHSNFTCNQCHGAGNTDINLSDNNSLGHAASVGITCLGCHGTAAVTGANVTAELGNANAAHKNLNVSNPQFAATADDACSACHTAVDVNMSGVTSLAYDSGTVNLTSTGGLW